MCYGALVETKHLIVGRKETKQTEPSPHALGHYQIHGVIKADGTAATLLELTSTQDTGLPFLPAAYPLTQSCYDTENI